MKQLQTGDFVTVAPEVVKKAELEYTYGLVLRVNDYSKGDKFPNWKYPIPEPITTAVLATCAGEDEINICWLTKKD